MVNVMGKVLTNGLPVKDKAREQADAEPRPCTIRQATLEEAEKYKIDSPEAVHRVKRGRPKKTDSQKTEEHLECETPKEVFIPADKPATECEYGSVGGIIDNPVSHPSHYTDGKIEVIDYIEDKGLNYHRGNAVKYISRAGKKDPAKEIEDLQKAAWYINREITRLREAQHGDE